MGKEIHFICGIRFLCVLAAGLFLLSACGKIKERDRKDTLAEAGDVDIGSDFEYHHVAESENGYYFWERMSDNRPYPRLMFLDKESGRVVPLCNKPNCDHEGRECNAYFPYIDFGENGLSKDHLQFYNENPFALGLSSDGYVALFRIKADGSEWEINTKLYRTDFDSTGLWTTPDVLFDDGYVYFVDHKQKKMKLERVPIGGSTAEVLFEGDENVLEVQI